MRVKTKFKLKPKQMIFIAVFILLITYLVIGTFQGLQVTHYTYSNSKIPPAFDGFKIVQLSDFHCKTFGLHEEPIIQVVADLQPDIIVITGDTIDQYHQDLHTVEDLLAGITPIAPVYAVSGNHEYDRDSQYGTLMDLYARYGVTYLDDSQVSITKDSSSFMLYGLSADKMNILYNRNAIVTPNSDQFSLVLYHYSNQFDFFHNTGFDLVLAGHTHGGVIRLPIVGGVIGNDHTFFPKYDAGVYKSGTTTMISNRGLGDESLKRFYNRPEIVCVTLSSTP